MPPMAFESTQSTSARTIQVVAPAVPDVVHEPEPEDESEPHPRSDRDHGDAGESEQRCDLAGPLPSQGREVEDPGHDGAAEDEERAR